MKESTKYILKLHGWRIDRAIHNYIYFNYYDTYVKTITNPVLPYVKKLDEIKAGKRKPSFLDKLAAKWLDLNMKPFAHRYHGKVISRDDAVKMLSLNESIDLGPDETKRIVPYKYATKIILSEPTHFAAMECPCKAAQPEHERCQPSKSCIAVGKNLVNFWMEHGEKFGVERLTREQVIERIDALRKTGHFNQAYFKVATGGRTGVICNCCEKCCGQGTVVKLIKDMTDRHRGKLAKIKACKLDPLMHNCASAPSGYTVKHDKEKCDLSGDCVNICPFEAVKITDGKYRYDPVACMGCGLCVEHCKQDALRLVFEDRGGYIPLDIDLVKERLKKTG